MIIFMCVAIIIILVNELLKEDYMITLEDTIDMMCSDNYEERLKAEYWQLVIRISKLKRCIYKLEDKIKEDIDEFESNELHLLIKLKEQLTVMTQYQQILLTVASIEDIQVLDIERYIW